MLLVMTVHPGFGGQSFRAEQMEKVKRAAEWNKTRDREINIEVDGGINAETARVAIQSGANVLVAGTSVWVTPTTSSIVVLPFATRRQPSCRKVSMPSVMADCLSSPPSFFCMINFRNGS